MTARLESVNIKFLLRPIEIYSKRAYNIHVEPNTLISKENYHGKSTSHPEVEKRERLPQVR